MDIAFIAKRYDRVGGTEVDLYHLTDLLMSFGHKVTIYCQEVKTSVPEGIVIRKVPSLGPGRTLKLWALAWLGPKMAFSGDHDIVLTFTRVLNQDIVRCGGGTHKIFLKKIMEAEGPLKRFLRKTSIYHNSLLAIEKRQLKVEKGKVLAISKIVKNELMEVYDVPDQKIEIIYDGIDLSRFDPKVIKAERQKTREEFGIPLDSKLILFLGNGFKRKGLATLLESIPLIHDEELYCLVVGGDKTMESYKNMAKELSIRERVVFTGVQKEAARFYGAADIFILPSLQEAFGNVVLEAMASGLSVITTRVAGASEVLSKGMEAFILENPHDVKGLALLIEKWLTSTNKEELSITAREIAGDYTLEANARAIERLCKEFMKEEKNGQIP